MRSVKVILRSERRHFVLIRRMTPARAGRWPKSRLRIPPFLDEKPNLTSEVARVRLTCATPDTVSNRTGSAGGVELSLAERRASGIPAFGDVPWGSHYGHFYRTEEDLTETLLPWFRAGVLRNERCLWITSQPAEATSVLR